MYSQRNIGLSVNVTRMVKVEKFIKECIGKFRRRPI